MSQTKRIRLVAAGFIPAVLFTTLGFAQSPAPREVIDKYCAGCHNDRAKTGGLSLQHADLTHPDQNAELFEKVIRKVRAGLMPPAGMPRPDTATLNGLAASLEGG